MRIFITGGSGFVGQNLVRLLLEKDHEIMCLTRERAINAKVNYIRADLRNTQSYKEALLNFSPNKVINLAWYGLPDYSKYNCEVSYQCAMSLFEIIKETDCKEILCTGSCWEYKDNQGKIDYKAELDVKSDFAVYKNKIRVDGNNMLRGSNTNLTWIRPFFIYGRNQRKQSLIPSCYDQLKVGLIPKINNPDAVNDFIHIDDVVSGISALIEGMNDERVYNLGSGRGTPVWHIVNIIAKTMHKEAIFLERSPKYRGNISDNKMLTLKGWKPKISIEDGIKSVVAEFEQL
ncbi:NAD(P)-dependent oxidoreductase [Synechococcus sp. HB1133]|uniref:NAD-dependent epimerase/dehydratase family protein n=1 Tax=unclassified Synechococcus TaxID=2626047 RepID=UPI0014091D0A|nr:MULTISPECIES: NAD(P)-dependent oxidoreductase [unclassified Synechococcus]MCB4421470.1 NAD(P)-dependent oxidoreductase [Synechococcus sp. HB1133]MCB4431179.1 NAD(P)-dependent oxidoreductase [Synechococcus sp. HBA1120]NHI80412.1 NAD(P)-dependent oxidoreductase [Synechococcus sp. HB1133]